MNTFRKIIHFIFGCFTLLATVQASAQTLERQVGASGGSAVVLPELQLDYTIGEAVIQPLSYSGTVLTQGFQQPPDFGSSANVKPLEMIIFPNPTWDDAYVRFKMEEPGTVNIRIVNMSGQVLQTDKVTTTSDELLYKIDCSRLVAGPYIVTLKVETGSMIATKIFIKMKW